MHRTPHDPGLAGTRNPDPPTPGTRFRALGSGGSSGTRCVEALICIADDRHHPPSFLVRAEDGTFWALVSANPDVDGLAFAGTTMQSA